MNGTPSIRFPQSAGQVQWRTACSTGQQNKGLPNDVRLWRVGALVCCTQRMDESPALPELLNTQEAAKYLGIGASRLNQIVASGMYDLAPVLIGKPNWYRKSDLDAFKNLERPDGRLGQRKPYKKWKYGDQREHT